MFNPTTPGPFVTSSTHVRSLMLASVTLASVSLASITKRKGHTTFGFCGVYTNLFSQLYTSTFLRQNATFLTCRVIFEVDRHHMCISGHNSNGQVTKSYLTGMFWMVAWLLSNEALNTGKCSSLRCCLVFGLNVMTTRCELKKRDDCSF